MKHFLTKLVAIETLKEFHQSRLVTRNVYYIDEDIDEDIYTNSLLGIVFS